MKGLGRKFSPSGAQTFPWGWNEHLEKSRRGNWERGVQEEAGVGAAQRREGQRQTEEDGGKRGSGKSGAGELWGTPSPFLQANLSPWKEKDLKIGGKVFDIQDQSEWFFCSFVF